MVLTTHAKTRLKEREGLGVKSANRKADIALEKGIRHCETKGNLNKWITKLYFANRSANNIRIYGDKAYIFDGNVLITVIEIPNSIRKNLKSYFKKK